MWQPGGPWNVCHSNSGSLALRPALSGGLPFSPCGLCYRINGAGLKRVVKESDILLVKHLNETSLEKTDEVDCPICAFHERDAAFHE